MFNRYCRPFGALAIGVPLSRGDTRRSGPPWKMRTDLEEIWLTFSDYIPQDLLTNPNA